MLHEPRETAKPGPCMTRLESFAMALDIEKPVLILDPDLMEQNYRALKAGLGAAAIHYAVKANPAPAFISRLVAIGSHFDAASKGEIALCLECGADPGTISFGNTVKKVADIQYAHTHGITLFAVDSEAEMEKIAQHAPGARVYVRLLVTRSAADYPLSRKFGCDHGKALELLDLARKLGLKPEGLSFHVGSQTRRAAMWAPVLDDVARTWQAALEAGHALTLLNIGGGFPAPYDTPVEDPQTYAAQVMAQVQARFGTVTRIMAEPGRGLVASAGAIACEVLLVARKASSDLHRWVYLDIGRFSGLAETEGEAIRYQVITPYDRAAPAGPAILAGPSCDSADVLYERRPLLLPMDLKPGDRMVIRNAGAYTSSYASVGFNGFPPLDVMSL